MIQTEEKLSCQQTQYYAGEFALNNFPADNREQDPESVF